MRNFTIRNFIYYSGLTLIAIWLFILHSAFAYSLNPIFLAGEFFKDLFALQNGYDLKIYFPYVFGAVFAIAIAAMMALIRKSDKHFWKFAHSVALMELIGMVMLCFPDHGDKWAIISAVYYGIYSYLVIIFYAYAKEDIAESQKVAVAKVARQNANATRTRNKNDEKVMQLNKEGASPLDIAAQLSINKSTVYRIINKHSE